MITINELFTNPNDEKVVKSINNLETFTEENNLKMADYAGILDYINLESDEERIAAIEFIINNANDSENIDMDSVDSIESLFYQEIDNMSSSVAHYLDEYSVDFLQMAHNINDTNASGQREISEIAMYELASKKDVIVEKLTEVYTIVNECLNHKDIE